MQSFPFSEDRLAWSERRIVVMLRRHGPMWRRDLQRKSSHRDQSADLFAAALTRLLDAGTIAWTDAKTLILVNDIDVQGGRLGVPEWDRSGRMWRTSRKST